MNWKTEAMDKLKLYEVKKKSLVSISEEIASLEANMCRIRRASGDGTSVKGSGRGQEDVMLSNIVLRQELEQSLKQAKTWVNLVDGALGVLSKEERLVLERLYLYPSMGNVDKLCGELCLEKTAVYNRRDKALRRFTIALYGAVETD